MNLDRTVEANCFNALDIDQRHVTNREAFTHESYWNLGKNHATLWHSSSLPLGSVTVQPAQQRSWTISSTSPQGKAWAVMASLVSLSNIYIRNNTNLSQTLVYCFSCAANLEGSLASFFYNLNIDFLYSLELMPLGVCRRERKTYVHGKLCAQVFISTFINNCPNWNNQETFYHANG